MQKDMTFYDHEMEEVVLGALMLEKNAIYEISNSLRIELFHLEKHQNICKSILNLFDKDQPIDLLTVKSELESMGKIKGVGGSYGLVQMTKRVNSAANIVYHIHILKGFAAKRELYNIGISIGKALERDDQIFETIENVESDLIKISSNALGDNLKGATETLEETMECLSSGINEFDRGEFNGVLSGYEKLDRALGGFKSPDFIVIAGRPGMGKTAFGMGAAIHASLYQEKKILVFSLEMSRVQLMNRAISAEAEVNGHILRNPNNETKRRMQDIIKASNKLSRANLWIDDTPSVTVQYIKSTAFRAKKKLGLDAIFIDYLQLMGGKETNSVERITGISRGLKAIAKSLEVPVIAFAQLNRNVESRVDKRPSLSDLKGAGSIEEDADAVMFLYRPEYYGITVDNDGVCLNKGELYPEGHTEVMLEKSRSGELGILPLTFIPQYTKFINF